MLKLGKAKYDYVIGFESKKDTKFLTEQDKRHIRIIAILKLAKDGQIENIIKHEFTETFAFDEESQTAIYGIRFIRKKGEKYADC